MAKKAKVKNWREFFESNPKELPLADINVRDKDGRTMFMVASSFASVKEIRRMIDAGADVNATEKDGKTPLIYAARHNEDPAVVKTLIKAGA